MPLQKISWADRSRQPLEVMGGCAQVVITPPLGTHLAGFFHVRVGERVRDELYAKAFVFEHDGKRLGWVGLDLICVDADFVQQAKAIVAKECGIAPEQLLISATHTHSGPEVRTFGAKVERNLEWLAALPAKIATAVRQACERFQPCTLHHGMMQVPDYVYNRLYRLRDGSEVHGKGNDPDKVLGPAGDRDAELHTLALRDKNRRLIGLTVNLGCHSCVIAGSKTNFFSKDWPGFIGENLAKIYGDDLVTVFLQGACGDTAQNPYQSSAYIPDGGEIKAVQMGLALAGAAMYAHEKADPMYGGVFSSTMLRVPVPYYTRSPELLAEMHRLRQAGEGTYRDVFGNERKLSDQTVAEYYWLKAVEEWQWDNQIADLPIQVMRLGEIAMVGVPFQIFTAPVKELKAWAPAPVMFVELANARCSSYVPTADQCERGAYGSKPIVSRWLHSDAARIVHDRVLVKLHELWSQNRG